MRAYVLCGGLGTRLRSVTGDTQKALVAVHGQPFLASVLGQLAAAGISDVVLCAHYRADQVAAQLASLSAASGLPLQLVVEGQLLGTGGALLNALSEQPPAGRYLVLNADTFLQAEAYQQMAAATEDTILAIDVADRSRYGSLRLNASGALQAIDEKGQQGAGLVNGGVYAFGTASFGGRQSLPCSLERELLPDLLQRQPVQVCQYAGQFIDIGTPESFARYCAEVQTSAVP